MSRSICSGVMWPLSRKREDMAGIVGDAADLAVPVGRHDRIVAAGPEQHRRAHDEHERERDPKLSAPDPLPPVAKDCLEHVSMPHHAPSPRNRLLYQVPNRPSGSEARLIVLRVRIVIRVAAGRAFALRVAVEEVPCRIPASGSAESARRPHRARHRPDRTGSPVPLVALAHQAERLGPARDELVDRELGGRHRLGAVEHLPLISMPV